MLTKEVAHAQSRYVIKKMPLKIIVGCIYIRDVIMKKSQLNSQARRPTWTWKPRNSSGFFARGSSTALLVRRAQDKCSSGEAETREASLSRLTGPWRIVFLCPLLLSSNLPNQTTAGHFYAHSYFLMRRHINLMALTGVHLIYEPPVKC